MTTGTQLPAWILLGCIVVGSIALLSVSSLEKSPAGQARRVEANSRGRMTVGQRLDLGVWGILAVLLILIAPVALLDTTDVRPFPAEVPVVLLLFALPGVVIGGLGRNGILDALVGKCSLVTVQIERTFERRSAKNSPVYYAVFGGVEHRVLSYTTYLALGGEKTVCLAPRTSYVLSEVPSGP